MSLLTELGNNAAPIYKHCAPPERASDDLCRYQWGRLVASTSSFLVSISRLAQLQEAQIYRTYREDFIEAIGVIMEATTDCRTQSEIRWWSIVSYALLVAF